MRIGRTCKAWCSCWIDLIWVEDGTAELLPQSPSRSMDRYCPMEAHPSLARRGCRSEGKGKTFISTLGAESRPANTKSIRQLFPPLFLLLIWSWLIQIKLQSNSDVQKGKVRKGIKIKWKSGMFSVRIWLLGMWGCLNSSHRFEIVNKQTSVNI